MLQRANYLITEYEIYDFPIPLDVIEKVIFDRKIKVQIIENIHSGLVIANQMLLPHGAASNLRENMVHEYCHTQYHVHNHFSSDKVTIAKNEAQAKAFAAYFLMPVYIFEESLKYCETDAELAEEYGVTLEFIQYRKLLTQSLMLSGYFK
ncbi:ImmA/IrrE family metallo-endopeptidase [Alkalibacter mobilis]|uniref:ImmA/IrrE family metallo-endopeptidase n=1 Tax=Alkalibacter mobilis TaxID=2787712 RepID=UPI00189F52A5|nr:ImmA/IrrE family metallo-endopeptidase [Alkalibacter mobilis]